MFGFALKSTFIYMVWNKFKKQIITAIISLLSIVIVFAIYEDINNIFIQKQIDYIFELVATKWFLVCLIIGFNIFSFKKAIKENKKYEDQDNSSIENTLTINTPQHKEILNKKKLKTKSDVILQRYLNKMEN